MSLSRTVTATPSQLGGIRWMDLDTVEQRYLLTAAADSTLEAFDVLVRRVQRATRNRLWQGTQQNGNETPSSPQCQLPT